MGKRILVVDDDAMNLRLAEKLLAKKEYEVMKAESGEECLALLKEESVDLVLLDIEMPGMNGWETLEAIRADEAFANIPVLFLSAAEDLQRQADAGQIPVEGFVKKPFLPPSLYAEVERVIGQEGA